MSLSRIVTYRTRPTSDNWTMPHQYACNVACPMKVLCPPAWHVLPASSRPRTLEPCTLLWLPIHINTLIVRTHTPHRPLPPCGVGQPRGTCPCKAWINQIHLQRLKRPTLPIFFPAGWIRIVRLGNFSHQPSKRLFFYEKLGVLLIATDFSKSSSTRPKPMRLGNEAAFP